VLHPITRLLLKPMRLPTAPLGEHGLLVCLLDRAVRDLTAKDRQTARSARRWFQSDRLDPLAFATVCDCLELDSQFVRRQLGLYRGGSVIC
jgi:hypothetical protein